MDYEYTEMYNRAMTGLISLDEWQEYCFELLKGIMQDNQEVFIRLRNC
jgi:hypothetical protein